MATSKKTPSTGSKNTTKSSPRAASKRSASSTPSSSHSGSSSHSKTMNNTSTILALAAGAVAGAGIALLLAPQSGDDTRRAIKRTAQNLKEDLSNTLQQGMDKITTIVSNNNPFSSGDHSKDSSFGGLKETSFGNDAGRMQSHMSTESENPPKLTNVSGGPLNSTSSSTTGMGTKGGSSI